MPGFDEAAWRVRFHRAVQRLMKAEEAYYDALVRVEVYGCRADYVRGIQSLRRRANRCLLVVEVLAAQKFGAKIPVPAPPVRIEMPPPEQRRAKAAVNEVHVS